MEFIQIEAFLAAAETGSFRRAAETLFLSRLLVPEFNRWKKN